MAETVTSADGSTIAYEVQGSGPTLLVIGGAFSSRQSAAPVVPPLAEHFTVVTFDRRGRGDSTDASNPPPHDREREVEDVQALVDALGGNIFVYGHSSGAALAFEAAAAGASIARVAGYEVPYIRQSEPTEKVAAALAAGDPDRATEIFLVTTGADPSGMRDAPFWPGLVAVAHTLPYDFALTDAGVPAERLAQIGIPALVMDGGASPEWAADAANEVAAAIPDATRRTIPDQTHAVSYEVLTPVLVEFFGE
jgi:pimeloyl-ACP methyl ester carboxylesterase